MKYNILGYTVTITKTANDPIEKRRALARLVLQTCNYSESVIERIKAVRQLGQEHFPDLRLANPDAGKYSSIHLVAAKDWVESAFANRGKGEIL